MIIMKFGGTSTQDATAITNVVGIVKRHLADRPVIVISAIARATNALEQAGKFAADGNAGEADSMLTELLDRHHAINFSVIKDTVRRAHIQQAIHAAHEELKELVRGVAILRELTPRTLDTFYAFGELLSSRLVAGALEEHGVPSLWLDTKEFMVTDDSFNRAQPMMDLVEVRLQGIAGPAIEKGIVPVTQGFIGATSSGRRTTMGRESSDYSAAVIGAALRASDIQIWTDVDGILTADPRVVVSPLKVKVLSFEEAFELSFFGAKVLHPGTMLPAIERNIPIHIYNSKRRNSSGTRVTSEHSSGRSIVKSIAYKRGVTLLSVVPSKRSGQYSFWESIYNILTKHGAMAQLTSTSEHKFSCVLDGKANVEALSHDLAELGQVEMATGRAIVCIVGSNLQQSSRLQMRMFASLEGVDVGFISYGSSTSNISFVVNDDKVLDAVRALHDEFFGSMTGDETFERLETAPVLA